MNFSTTKDVCGDQNEDDGTSDAPSSTDLNSLDIVANFDYLRDGNRASKEEQREDPDIRAGMLRLANRIPLYGSQNPHKQATTNLYNSLKVTDAYFQIKSSKQRIMKYAKVQHRAQRFFRKDSYDHLIAGDDLRAADFYNEEQLRSPSRMEEDKDFRAFVREAKFEDGRKGRQPDLRDIVATIKYADQKEHLG